MNIAFVLVALAALLISLSTHEYCHALVAYYLGDHTAKNAGRLTLNPIAHIDPVGTILVPLIGAVSGFPVIGWAKPVPFNPYNLKYGKWGPVMVALAGPISNFLMAGIYLLLLRLAVVTFLMSSSNLLVLFLTLLVMVNVVLGIFNFIPVPPLDGSKLLHALLTAPKYRNTLVWLETRGPMVLLLIIFADYLLNLHILAIIFSAAINTVFALGGL
ncbi:MAG: site-2 protease family protein [Patescibacteria group bacterium]|nr:site-2 protease family protein [Patescibacteria group bacterium]